MTVLCSLFCYPHCICLFLPHCLLNHLLFHCAIQINLPCFTLSHSVICQISFFPQSMNLFWLFVTKLLFLGVRKPALLFWNLISFLMYCEQKTLRRMQVHFITLWSTIRLFLCSAAVARKSQHTLLCGGTTKPSMRSLFRLPCLTSTCPTWWWRASTRSVLSVCAQIDFLLGGYFEMVKKWLWKVVLDF